ncbi:hypothetical protein WN71_021270 [Streptomyces mangrovisoli]|uniref:Uncharacterized protein n=1 Tax=Streptomyces mangrovisoli TaxID=1428628 RepID=A0A1J4NU91_9ACTN|nr:hypothetical protein WN71_021270 [Streptomyces mangrovisoli]
MPRFSVIVPAYTVQACLLRAFRRARPAAALRRRTAKAALKLLRGTRAAALHLHRHVHPRLPLRAASPRPRHAARSGPAPWGRGELRDQLTAEPAAEPFAEPFASGTRPVGVCVHPMR